MSNHGEGLTPFELIRELRSVKLKPAARKRLLELDAAFKARALVYEEARELRLMYGRYVHLIVELRQAREAARITSARAARGGTKADDDAKRFARKTQRSRLASKIRSGKKDLEELEAEELDFGF